MASNGAAPANALPATVARVEFLGAFCLVGIALDGAGVPALVANVSRQVVDAARLMPGQAVTVSLPPDRVARARLTRRRNAIGDVRRGASTPSVAGGPAAPALARPARAVAAARLLPRAGRLPAGAAGDDPRQERAGQGRRVRRARAVPRVLRDTGAAQLDLEHAVGRDGGDGDHRAARVRLRVRAHALVHAGQGRVPRDRADADPRAEPDGGDLVHPVVRQPGGAEVAARRGVGLRPARHHPELGRTRRSRTR